MGFRDRVLNICELWNTLEHSLPFRSLLHFYIRMSTFFMQIRILQTPAMR